MARTLNPTDGFIFHGWMVTGLRLSGNELVAFALVHQFSQSDAGIYNGGPRYLAEWIGCTVDTARKYLHSLMQKGLIENEDTEINGVLFRSYRVKYPLKNLGGYPKKQVGVPQNLGIENNIENNINISISNPLPPTRFSFLKELEGIGVKRETAEAWLQVRKAKKGVNTEIAFNAICEELKKADNEGGKKPEDCIRFAVEHSWCGFKWKWMQNELTDTARGGAPAYGRDNQRRGSDSFDHMMQVGRNLGIIGGGEYDEQ